MVGRTSDFIIRGGKNISAAAVEEEVVSHPAIDPLRRGRDARPGVRRAGLRVRGAQARRRRSTLDDIVAHLRERGVSKEWYPEHLIVVDELPPSDGGKIAKAVLREDLRRRMQLS